MPTVVKLAWNKCKGNIWGNLYTVDLGSPHFERMDGVIVVWHGGPAPKTVLVGYGQVRELLVELRRDPKLLAYKDQGLFVTWAKVDPLQRGGVMRFVGETLQPLIRPVLPETTPIEVNLPGRDGPSGTLPPDSFLPGQTFEDMVAREGAVPNSLKARDVLSVAPPKPTLSAPAPTAPRLKVVSNLHKIFTELIEKRKQAPKSGFFGGSSGGKSPDETLVISVVQLIMQEAMRMRTSDIHIEPMEPCTRIRFRVDGILEEVLEISRAHDLRVVSHIRVMCGLDPEPALMTGKPQDGRMMANVDGQEADLRLSTFPTPYGEKAVLRIIPRNVRVPNLTELGIEPKVLERLEEVIHRPQGMIVVTGPAGSGKSTTLYTMLQTLNEPTRNIVTLEDPIEQKIQGITQGALQARAGFTFAEGLRAILRQDPNIVMVGEIRDRETAEIAMSAALTGHLLFTTLHTNSALGAITRLLDMGLEPFLIASALTSIIAQRLARQVCSQCREIRAPTQSESAQLQDLAFRMEVQIPESLKEALPHGRGCAACRDSGYQGRILLFEYVGLSPELRQMILRKAPSDELRKKAVQDGMATLIHDGFRKAAAGLTSLAELVRVVGAGE